MPTAGKKKKHNATYKMEREREIERHAFTLCFSLPLFGVRVWGDKSGRDGKGLS